MIAMVRVKILDTKEIAKLPWPKRLLFLASAGLAALLGAVLLVNFVVMPVMVRQGDLATVPDLVGLSMVDAERVAEKAGLRLRVDTERPDPAIPADHVSSQDPRAGTEMKRGRTMALVLSSGIDMRRLPRLRRLTARQAELEAERAGFLMSGIVEAHSDRIERGRVIGSDPESGTVLPAGSGVRILVSLGSSPRELVMPSLVGRSPEEARAVAEELGLTVRSVKYERVRGRGRLVSEVVVVQDPVAGSRVAEGEGVVLRVGPG